MRTFGNGSALRLGLLVSRTLFLFVVLAAVMSARVQATLQDVVDALYSLQATVEDMRDSQAETLGALALSMSAVGEGVQILNDTASGITPAIQEGNGILSTMSGNIESVGAAVGILNDTASGIKPAIEESNGYLSHIDANLNSVSWADFAWQVLDTQAQVNDRDEAYLPYLQNLGRLQRLDDAWNVEYNAHQVRVMGPVTVDWTGMPGGGGGGAPINVEGAVDARVDWGEDGDTGTPEPDDDYDSEVDAHRQRAVDQEVSADDARYNASENVARVANERDSTIGIISGVWESITGMFADLTGSLSPVRIAHVGNLGNEVQAFDIMWDPTESSVRSGYEAAHTVSGWAWGISGLIGVVMTLRKVTT